MFAPAFVLVVGIFVHATPPDDDDDDDDESTPCIARTLLYGMTAVPQFQGKNGIPLLALREVRDVELMMNDDSWLK